MPQHGNCSSNTDATGLGSDFHTPTGSYRSYAHRALLFTVYKRGNRLKRFQTTQLEYRTST